MLTPLPNEGWNDATAAHLLNRAGFGGAPGAVERLRSLGLEGAVDSLLKFGGAPDDEIKPPSWTVADPDRGARLREFSQATPEKRKELQRQERRTQMERMMELRGWWLERMVRAPHPLQEKLTLYWHGHFATSMVKVRDARMMWMQNELFRNHAAGNWRVLVKSVTEDPAMLIWLDQAQSRRQHPNENYARELMELFTLGEGHYTETDVQEAARALTGVSLDRARGEYVYRPRLHDDGEKRFLGRSGRLGAGDVVETILGQPQAARFLASKLWTFFASDDPPAGVVDALAEDLRRGDWEMRPVLRRMFLSAEFYDTSVLRSQVKSPVQLLVGAVLQLDAKLPAPLASANALRSLGQELFAPPNVKGWDGGLNWLATHHLLNRHRLADWLVLGEGVLPSASRMPNAQRLLARVAGRHPDIDMSRLLPESDRGTPEKAIAALERRFLHARLRPKAAAALRELIGASSKLGDGDVARAIRFIMCTPDYQLT